MELIKLYDVKIVESGCDGIACALMALREEGVDIIEYNATEKSQSAIKLAARNFPEIKHHGDFMNISLDRIRNCDFFIAGVPCQTVSINGKRLGFEDDRALFHRFAYYKQYLRSEAIFLLENVGSMSHEIKKAIDELLGVTGIEINSNEFCAQNRSRIYWTNIPLRAPWSPKDIKRSAYKVWHILERNPDSKLFLKESKINEQLIEATETNEVVTLNPRRKDGKQTYQQDRIYDSVGKFPTLTASLGNRFNIKDDKGFLRRLSIREQARLQTIPDWYSFNAVSDLQASHAIGNAMTVKVIRYILRCAI